MKLNFPTIIPICSALCLLNIDLTAQLPAFYNVTSNVNINFRYDKPYFAGGLSFVDVNKDGFDDLTFSSSLGQEFVVYTNKGGRFKHIGDRVAITDTSKTQTLLWADYDNDGDYDLFITSVTGPDQLWRNDLMGNYVEVALDAAIVSVNDSSQGACWADFDNDGWIDLYVTKRAYFDGNYLFLNNRDGTFTDVTVSAGVRNYAKLGMTVSALDYDNDGWQDIFVANDLRKENTLFKNNGNLTFTDVSVSANANQRMDAMGIAIGDYDFDSDLDIYISNTPGAGNVFLQNNGDGTFDSIAEELGVAVHRFCWGVNFLDFDNDADLDLFSAVSSDPDDVGGWNTNVLFTNNGDGTFSENLTAGLNYDSTRTFGSAIGDYNNDGYVDMAILNFYPTPSSALYRNNHTTNNNWIKLFLEGTISNKDAIGSVIEIYYQGIKLIRTTHSSISWQSQDSYTQTIGVGSVSQIDSIIIKWPSRLTDKLTNVSVNQLIHVVESGSNLSKNSHLDVKPDKFLLKQNNPNPFNPVTTIEFQLKREEFISLKVYDLTGREISTLAEGIKAAGSHKITFDASDFSSGIYLYKLQNERNTEVRKMMLLK